MNTKEQKKIQEGLMIGLKQMDIQTDSAVAIILLLKSEDQMLTMLDYIVKHSKENPPEDEVIQVAKKISEQVS